MAERHGNWKDWLLCLAAIVYMQTPSFHNSRWYKRHPEAPRPDTTALPRKKKPVGEISKTGWLAFFENPLFLLPVGIFGGLLGLTWYTPLSLLSIICVLLAMHRAQVLVGLRLRTKALCYLVATLSMATLLYFTSLQVQVHSKQFIQQIADAVAEKGNHSKATPIATTSDVNNFHVTIDHFRPDWDKPYNPRTLFMAYYLLNGAPTLSPIDAWIHAKVSNLEQVPQIIESWSLETGPTESGPWKRLNLIPSGKHIDLYLVGSLKGEGCCMPVALDDLDDALTKPIPEKGKADASGWAFIECEGQPPCLYPYARFVIQDQSGMPYYQVIHFPDEIFRDRPISRSSTARKINMDNIPLMRPFPFDGYRSEPNGHGPTQIFRAEK
jgi:hypothetical protein